MEMQNLNGEAQNQDNQNNDVEQTEENQNNHQETTPEDLKKTITNIDLILQRHLKNAFVLMNLYYLFQGIVLSAVSQVSSPKCHHRYFFFALSIIPFLLNGVPLIYVVSEYVKDKNVQDRYNLQLERIRIVRPTAEQQVVQEAAAEDAFGKGLYYFGLIIVAVVLIGFNGALLFACNSLLCDNMKPSTPYLDYHADCFTVCNNQSKCLKICTA